MTKINPQEMYNGLLALCNNDSEKKFIYEDHYVDDKHLYRVFTYRIPRYMDYQLPYGKECRGTMFLIKKDTKEMVSLIALPMPKFFTYEENPETSKIDFSKIKRAFLKPDGSLISSYIHIDGSIGFKTKKLPYQKSFTDLINSVLNDEYRAELTALTQTHTIDFELTSPKNRVILSYDTVTLHVLKARSRETGEFLDIYTEEFAKQYSEIAKNLVKPMDIQILKDLDAKNKNLDIHGIEGVVIEMDDGTMMKVKTVYYLSQNRFANIQDFSKYDKLLVEACIEETFDELRTLFHYRNRSENYGIDEILSRMDTIENKVVSTFNPFVAKIESFYKEHKELEPKDYQQAIVKNDMKDFMGILMPMYKGNKVNLKTHYMKRIGRTLKSN